MFFLILLNKPIFEVQSLMVEVVYRKFAALRLKFGVGRFMFGVQSLMFGVKRPIFGGKRIKFGLGSSLVKLQI